MEVPFSGHRGGGVETKHSAVLARYIWKSGIYLIYLEKCALCFLKKVLFSKYTYVQWHR